MNEQPETRQPRKRINRAEWRPEPSSGGRIAVAAAVTLALCSAAAGLYLLAQPVGGASAFVAALGAACGVLALVLGAIAVAYYSVRYRLSEGQLTISCLWMRERIPLGLVDGLFNGRRLGKRVRVEGLRWPGLYVGQATVPELGRIRFYGTSVRPSASILVQAGERVFAITPNDLEGFRAELISRLEALPEGAARAAEPVSEGVLVPRLSLLRDRVSLALLGAALVALAISFAYVAVKLPGLPTTIPLHFGAAGQPDMVVPRDDAFRMPIISMLILGFNGVVALAVHAWQRDTGRVLAGATLFVELVALSATLRVVH